MECRKLYVELKLTAEQQKLVTDSSQSQQSVCGAPLSKEVEVDTPAEGGVGVVRHGLNCASPVEVPYFSCKLDIPKCCIHCGAEEHLFGGAIPAKPEEKVECS